VVKLDVTPEELDLIVEITARAFRLTTDLDIKASQAALEMDITGCHYNGCPLDLAKLARARDADLAHDVFGIHRNLNRFTGRLENGFQPRHVKGSPVHHIYAPLRVFARQV
jgi:hypothetical protein